MHDVAIIGLRKVKELRPNNGGYTIISFFDCQTNGFELNGCALVRTPRNGLTVWPPKPEAAGQGRRSIHITDERLRVAMLRKAQDAYRAFGGHVDLDADDDERDDAGLSRILAAG